MGVSFSLCLGKCQGQPAGYQQICYGFYQPFKFFAPLDIRDMLKLVFPLPLLVWRRVKFWGAWINWGRLGAKILGTVVMKNNT